MPRRQSKAKDGGKEGGEELTTASYLDSFLNRAPARSPLRRQRPPVALCASGVVASRSQPALCCMA
jgi:hypothetical protein